MPPAETPAPIGWARVRGRLVAAERRVSPLARFAARVVPVLVVAAVGAAVAVGLFGHTEVTVGPFDTTMSIDPVSSGGTEVQLSPLGEIALDSHDGPLGLSVELDQLREVEARAIAEDPEGFTLDEGALADDVRAGVVRLGQRVLISATLGGALLSTLWRRRWRATLAGGLVGLVFAVAATGSAVRSWEPESLAEPRYTGLLSLAPQAVGDARDVVDRFADYQAQLAGIIENVALLYQGANDIRSFQPDAATVRVLHVSDLHLNPQAFDLIDQIVPQFGIDVVVDTGDINDWGTSFEAAFVERISDLDVPYVFVRGNHDSAATARAVAGQTNAVVLDGEGATVAGLTFWGKGDPRFTPDKSLRGSGDDEVQVAEDEAPILAREVRSFGADEIDVVLVHDPAVAADLGDVVPLVLAGHRHRANQLTLGDDTTLLVEGSTGGAGLRSLQEEDPVPLSCSVLYFDSETGGLQALDRIVVGGVNQADVRIERTLVAELEDPPEDDPPEDDPDTDDPDTDKEGQDEEGPSPTTSTTAPSAGTPPTTTAGPTSAPGD